MYETPYRVRKVGEHTWYVHRMSKGAISPDFGSWKEAYQWLKDNFETLELERLVLA